MNEQQRLEKQLQQLASAQHQLWERERQITAFLGESLAQIVNTCLAQKHELKKQRDQLSHREDNIRIQLRKLLGPEYRCTCAEYIHTGGCDHMERVNELVSREEN